MIPTSNHNLSSCLTFRWELYIFWFLHQTTTCNIKCLFDQELYIFWFLHQTTTALLSRWVLPRCISFDSYIKPQLVARRSLCVSCCISFDSYIKPQLADYLKVRVRVVYLLIPTSNHNLAFLLMMAITLYIFWFLHQTTTKLMHYEATISCISFDSYIKPQLCKHDVVILFVVYLLIPTSNHNL